MSAKDSNLDGALIGGKLPPRPAAEKKAAIGNNFLKLPKLKQLLTQVGATQNPLFGEGVAQKAREATNIVHVDLPFAGKTMDLLRKIFRDKSVNAMMYDAKQQPTKGVMVDFAGALSPEVGNMLNKVKVPIVGKQLDTFAHLDAIGNSKKYEAAAFPELIGKTVSLADLAKSRKFKSSDHSKLWEALHKEFDGKFVVKPDSGVATAGSALVTDKKTQQHLTDLMRKGLRNAHGAKFSGAAKNLVAQRRFEIAANNRLERAANNITELLTQRGEVNKMRVADTLKAALGGELPFKAKGSMSGGTGKEFRVHVIDGKVVPYATTGRGSVLGNLPIRTPNMRRAEKALQEKLVGIDPSRLSGTWAFDVAKSKGGDFNVIETNPSIHGGSGMVSNLPHIQDALAAALQGRIPRYMRIQQGALAGSGIAGASALSGDDT